MFNEVSVRELQSDALALQLVKKIDTQRVLSSEPSLGDQYLSAQNVASSARQAIAYTTAADQCSIEVMPVLRYYQWLHTLKTLLYIFVPGFPKSASVLQHGLSVRRIKRSTYRWPLEKLHVHNEGILQAFHSLCTAKTGWKLPEKIVVGDLIGSIPQLAPVLGDAYGQFEHAYPLYTLDDVSGLDAVSRHVASNQGMTLAEWRDKYEFLFSSCTQSLLPDAKSAQSDGLQPGVQRLGKSPPGALRQVVLPKYCHLKEPPGFLYIQRPAPNHPWLREYEGIRFLVDEHAYHSYLVHYGLLYSLSALSRYSATEWSDIIHWHSEEDALLVREYLRLPQPRPVIRSNGNAINIDCLYWKTGEGKNM